MKKALIIALPLMFLFSGKIYAEETNPNPPDPSTNTVVTQVKDKCMILSVETKDGKTVQATGQCPGKEPVTVTNEGDVHTLVDGQPVNVTPGK